MAQDGTFPVRVVTRCLADTTDQLWYKGSMQSLYKPRDLHVTHICIYAVGPQFIHKCLLDTHAVRTRIRDMELEGWHIITSKMIAASVAASHEEHGEYPQTGLMVFLQDEHQKPPPPAIDCTMRASTCSANGRKAARLTSELAS